MKTTGDLCREHNICAATSYAWKAKDGGLEVNEAQELKRLREEHSKLKRVVADLTLYNLVLKDLLTKNRWWLPHAEPPVPDRVNQSWAMDFMQDGLANGRTLRILTVIYRYTREALALEVDPTISGLRVRRVLDPSRRRARLPRRHHVDNGVRWGPI